MDKYLMWIHYERLHNHNKAKHNKTVCIFLGIYCSSLGIAGVTVQEDSHLSSVLLSLFWFLMVISVRFQGRPALGDAPFSGLTCDIKAAWLIGKIFSTIKVKWFNFLGPLGCGSTFKKNVIFNVHNAMGNYCKTALRWVPKGSLVIREHGSDNGVVSCNKLFSGPC